MTNKPNPELQDIFLRLRSLNEELHSLYELVADNKNLDTKIRQQHIDYVLRLITFEIRRYTELLNKIERLSGNLNSTIASINNLSRKIENSYDGIPVYGDKIREVFNRIFIEKANLQNIINEHHDPEG